MQTKSYARRFGLGFVSKLGSESRQDFRPRRKPKLLTSFATTVFRVLGLRFFEFWDYGFSGFGTKVSQTSVERDSAIG